MFFENFLFFFSFIICIEIRLKQLIHIYFNVVKYILQENEKMKFLKKA